MNIHLARVAGLGVVKLAQHSGRPIYLVAMASSRRIELNNWDRTAINMPFSRIGITASGPIFVAQDSDSAGLERARQRLETELNTLTKRAYELADNSGGTLP